MNKCIILSQAKILLLKSSAPQIIGLLDENVKSSFLNIYHPFRIDVLKHQILLDGISQNIVILKLRKLK